MAVLLFVAADASGPHAAGTSDRYAPASDSMPNQHVLLRVSLNGLDQGEHLFDVDPDGLSMPPETAKALHVADRNGARVRLQPDGPIAFRHDLAASALELSVPAGLMEFQRFAPETSSDVHLSAETWGAWVNYDVNLRHTFGAAGGSRSSPVAFGGVGDLRLVGPDLVGSFGWAYDSGDMGRGGPVRLDSMLNWRPAADQLSAAVGDLLSPTDTLSGTRQYHFVGIQAGTDFSGTPGFSTAPIASVYGSAQAQSVLELVLDGQRAYSTSTAGGPFAMSLPPGAGGAAAVVVTDVTGRSVLLPVEVPRVDAQLLRQGLLVWSAGAGLPRFGYGTADSSYSADPYGYFGARYGAFDRMTLRVHSEFGERLAELEIGADVVALPTVAIRGTLAASRSDRGMGGQGRFALSAVGPWHLNFDTSFSQTVGAFDDVVSASGRHFAIENGLKPLLTLPSISDLTARLSWQASRTLGFSASYQMSRFEGSGSVGIASLSANTTVLDLPVFANVFRTLGGRRSTTVLAGLSFQIGGAQGSASAGAGLDSGHAQSGDGPSGTLNVGQPLGQQIGSTGWNVIATRGPNGQFADASVEQSTGYGVAGASVQSSGAATTAYATLRGSAGLIGWHPFVSDPVSGGVVVVDAGQSGVPVQLNGDDRGRTSFDGKLLVSGAVAGVPQHISIDAMDLAIDAVPNVTEGEVTLREGAATMLPFRVQSNAAAASFRVLFHGQPPPVGSTVFGATSNAPVGKDGRAYLPSINADEVLRVETPDGLVCLVKTRFDGRGGVGRRLGTLSCEGAAG